METATDTGQSPSNPAADAARAELQAVATNPSHALHSAWTRNDHEAVQRHMKPYYDKITGPGSITLGQGIELAGRPATQPAPQPTPHTEPQAETPSLEERVAMTDYDNKMKEILGDQHELEMEDGRIGMSHLFGADDEGRKAGDYIVRRLTALGPEFGARAIRLAAEVGRLIHTQQRRTA